jgi:hypothetical protein
MFNAQIRMLSSAFDLVIALPKRSRFDYHIDQRYEAGIALQGWELKALRAGRNGQQHCGSACHGTTGFAAND